MIGLKRQTFRKKYLSHRNQLSIAQQSPVTPSTSQIQPWAYAFNNNGTICIVWGSLDSYLFNLDSRVLRIQITGISIQDK